MPVCVRVGAVVDPATGGHPIAVDPTNTDLSTCAYVLQTAGEYGAGNAFFLNQISIADAQIIAAHIGIVWAVAWGFRQAANLVRDLNPSERD